MQAAKRSRTTDTSPEDYRLLKYMSGFGNEFLTEAVENCVPRDQNSPQQVNNGLYAELLSGSAFTAPRLQNQRVWYYRIFPSVRHDAYTHVSDGTYDLMLAKPKHSTPQQFRWGPHPLAQGAARDFTQGLVRYAGSGDPAAKAGLNVYVYAFDTNMTSNKRAFLNADGDFLIVPQQGTLIVHTENGILRVEPEEVVVIPRGITFAVDCEDIPHDATPPPTTARGYVAEAFDGHFVLPERSIIGTTGLAENRHFLVPTAAYDDDTDASGAPLDGRRWRIVHKYNEAVHAKEQPQSPFNVVGWHGNYYPFKYDLRLYNVMNTVCKDHIDPSIFCVMSVMTNTPGVAALDFVIFPPRWSVQEGTFRPPYFHRNCMSEFMGLIKGTYEAKHGGFVPGGSSLHSVMAAHGPDVGCFNGASVEELVPKRVAEGTMAFMFESGSVACAPLASHLRRARMSIVRAIPFQAAVRDTPPHHPMLHVASLYSPSSGAPRARPSRLPATAATYSASQIGLWTRRRLTRSTTRAGTTPRHSAPLTRTRGLRSSPSKPPMADGLWSHTAPRCATRRHDCL